jgi:protein-S-isoprenylcysteine O-methyltransferase Ste14
VASTDKVDLQKDGGGSPKETVTEVWTLVRDYAKQETVDPLKRLLGFAKFGLPGAILLGIGVIELMVAVLRAAQAEGGDVLDGRWSWVPYVITLVVAGAVLLWTKKAISSRKPPTEPA